MTIFTNFDKIDNFRPAGKPESNPNPANLTPIRANPNPTRVELGLGASGFNSGRANSNPEIFFSRVEPGLTFNPARPARVAPLMKSLYLGEQNPLFQTHEFVPFDSVISNHTFCNRSPYTFVSKPEILLI